MIWHCTSNDVTTVATVHHRVHTGISKNHCSNGNWPIAPPPPPPPPSILSMSMVSRCSVERPGGAGWGEGWDGVGRRVLEEGGGDEREGGGKVGFFMMEMKSE